MARTAGTASRHPADEITAVKAALEQLVVERQRLRASGAGPEALEANRQAIAEHQLRFAQLAWRHYGKASGSPPFS